MKLLQMNMQKNFRIVIIYAKFIHDVYNFIIAVG